MAKRANQAENVEAAHDRLIALTAGSGTIGADVKTLYQRILDVSGELEALQEDTRAKLLEIDKERKAETRKFKTQIDNLIIEVTGLREKQDRIVGAINGPAPRTVKYTREPDED